MSAALASSNAAEGPILAANPGNFLFDDFMLKIKYDTTRFVGNDDHDVQQLEIASNTFVPNDNKEYSLYKDTTFVGLKDKWHFRKVKCSNLCLCSVQTPETDPYDEVLKKNCGLAVSKNTGSNYCQLSFSGGTQAISAVYCESTFAPWDLTPGKFLFHDILLKVTETERFVGKAHSLPEQVPKMEIASATFVPNDGTPYKLYKDTSLAKGMSEKAWTFRNVKCSTTCRCNVQQPDSGMFGANYHSCGLPVSKVEGSKYCQLSFTEQGEGLRNLYCKSSFAPVDKKDEDNGVDHSYPFSMANKDLGRALFDNYHTTLSSLNQPRFVDDNHLQVMITELVPTVYVQSDNKARTLYKVDHSGAFSSGTYDRKVQCSEKCECSVQDPKSVTFKSQIAKKNCGLVVSADTGSNYCQLAFSLKESDIYCKSTFASLDEISAASAPHGKI